MSRLWGEGSALGRGWSMARATSAVLRQYPRLTIFPVLSGLAFLLVGGFIGSSFFPQTGRLHTVAAPIWDRLGADDAGQFIFYGVAFVVIYILTAVAIFFNVALVHCALCVHRGQDVSVRSGLAAAVNVLPQILGWAFVAATVGVLLKALENFLADKLGFLGSLISGLFAFGWSVVTYFVLPVLAAEKVGPVAAVRRSSALLRSKWGESVSGEIRFGLLGMLFFLMAALVFFAGLALELSGSGTALRSVGVLLMASGVLFGLATIVVLQALSMILQAGLYVYATTGNVPPSLDRPLLDGAFRPKKT